MRTKADSRDPANFLDEEPANTVNPSSLPPPPLPPILHGWAELGLLDPRRDGQLRTDGSTADVLGYAAMPAGSEDPVEGLLENVRAIAAGQAALLSWVDRSIRAARLLRRRIDDRAPKAPSAEEREASTRVPAEEQERARASVAAQRRAAGHGSPSEPPPANE